ncbi:CRISPR-associated protein Cas4 [Minwuia thermotolerans]|uniref:CRISPR-associated exonuclease Cas4 n=1 Tax=Minwuia thermotolerans TaxID=2056226 RepID=A0A2M9G0J1_9PROT|nr:CRISPR-associated protein Cas4 [Minwuia thermotolerans]PJK29223.1 CRISPR-associated protein Cas4 [Minwuia thermotolerans]
MPEPPADDEPVPLSALQHYLFCPRQCALIHVERIWTENRETAEGRLLHERTDRPGAGVRGSVRIERAAPLRSIELGVSGIADVIEFHIGDDGETPYPVEYKRGRPKAHRADEVQLCAQGMALEEMTGRAVAGGAIYYGAARRRREVDFDPELRDLTRAVAAATAAMLGSGTTPPAVYDAARCDRCSLYGDCLPKTFGRRRDLGSWLRRLVEDSGP